MYLGNHIVNRLLSDHKFWLELLELGMGNGLQSKWAATSLKSIKLGAKLDMDAATEEDRWQMQFLAEKGRLFLVTNTVIDKLDLLKPKKTESGTLDWTVFKNLSDLFTSTFILPNNESIRIRSYDHIIFIQLLTLEVINKKENKGHLNAHYIYIDRSFYTACSHLETNEYMKSRSEYIYKLMSFIYLSDIEEEILKPGHSKGTKKQGKILNTLGHPITIINSKWNITAIRNEAFGVSGHFAIRWCGMGRTEARVVWIDPFTKNGYIRKAKSLDHGN